MKKIIFSLVILVSMSSFASGPFEAKVERYNLLVQTGKISTQDFTDLVSALNPNAQVEIRKETREERIQRWEALLESRKITGQDYRDLVSAQDTAER